MENINSEKLLNALGKNLSMAIQSLDIIMPDIDDVEFKDYIARLNDEYNVILNELQMIA